MTRNKILSAACLSLLTTFSTTRADSIKNIDTAILSGEKYIMSSIQTDQYTLACKSSNAKPCPVSNLGKIMSGFFIVQALKLNHQIPDDVRNKILAMIDSDKRTVGNNSSAWGYATITPLDADDTSNALQTLMLLGKKITIDGLSNFYVPGERAYTTLIPDHPLPQPAKPMTEFTTENSYAIHSEVNANIFALFHDLHLDSKINYPLIKAFQAPQGYWHNFFYPGKYYSTYMSMKLLCQTEISSPEIDKGIKFIISSQNRNGAWGEPANAYETSLALNTLFACHKNNTAALRGITYLVKTQNKLGYWQSGQPIWHIIYTQTPFVLWQSYDNHHVMTTALAVLALKNYRNLHLEKHKNG